MYLKDLPVPDIGVIFSEGAIKISSVVVFLSAARRLTTTVYIPHHHRGGSCALGWPTFEKCPQIRRGT